VNVVALLCLDDCFKRSLSSVLHPLSLREELVALFVDFGILEHHGVSYCPGWAHYSECNAVFVHVHTDNRVGIVLVSNSVLLVGDGNVESPLIMFVNDFRRPDAPLVFGECGSKTVELVGAAAKIAFDVIARLGTDSEANRLFVLDEQAISLSVVHHHRVQSVDVGIRSAPAIVFVVVIRSKLSESFVNDELAGVFDVVGVVYNCGFDVTPVPAFTVETIGFVADAPGFETPGLRVVATPRIDI
jgi:hypothetical protein